MLLPALGIIFSSVGLFVSALFGASPALAAGSGTISQLDPWVTSGGTIKLSSTTANLRIPSLTNCDTIDTNSLGVLSCGSDATGAGGGTFPFTPQTYGNSTSTTIGFLQGLFSVGSTTISGLTSGFVGNNNGKLYGFASSSVTSLPNLATLSTSLTGILKASSGVLSAAANGTDFTLITAKTCNAGDFVSAVTAAGVFTCTTPTGTTYTGTFPIQVSGSVISSLFSTTTNSGMSAGNLYVGSGGVFQTAASSSIFGYTPLNPTRQLTVTGTANQVTSSAGAQDLSVDRTWTLSLPSHVIFPGTFQVTNSTTTNATTTGSAYFTGITASRPLYVDSTGKLGSAGSGTSGNCVQWGANNALGDAGAACGTGGFAFPWTAQSWGNSTSTLIGLLGGLQVNNASSSIIGNLQLGSTTQSTYYQTSLTGFLTKTFSYASSTQGSGTTTRSIGVAPTGATFKTAQCYSNSWMRILLYHSGGSRSDDLIASSTIGKFTYSSNTAFTNAEGILIDIGTTTNIAANVYVSCTLWYVYN